MARLSYVLVFALAACGAHATTVAEPVVPTPVPEPVAPPPLVATPTLPACWTSDVVPEDASARARLEAIAQYLAMELRAAETGDLDGLDVVSTSFAAEVRDTHTLITDMPLDLASWRCPRVTAFTDVVLESFHVAESVTLVFGADEPLTLQLDTDAGREAVGDTASAWIEMHAVLVRELLRRTLGPTLAAWEAARPELHHVSRIAISDALDWIAVTTTTESVQCLREHEGGRVLAQHCWRSPRHEGFLPAIGGGPELVVSRRVDGTLELRGLTVESEPQVVWEVRLPEETYTPIDARGRRRAPHPLAIVAPPDLGVMGPVLIEWHARIRRAQTPFGEAQCGTREGRFFCVYARQE